MRSSPRTQTAETATLKVDTSNIEINMDGNCSLRKAIPDANMDTCVDNCIPGTGVDKIILPPGEDVPTLSGSVEALAFSGDLDITNALLILGPSPSSGIITANRKRGWAGSVKPVAGLRRVMVSEQVVSNQRNALINPPEPDHHFRGDVP